MKPGPELTAYLRAKPEERCSLVAYLHAKPAKQAELVKILQGVVAPTRKAAGCIEYHLHVSDDDPDVIVAYEIWRSRKQLEEHLKTVHIGAFWVNRMDFLTEDADIRFCTEI